MTKIMILSKNNPGLFKRFVSSTRVSFAFLVCLLAVILAYRIQLTAGLFSSSVRPFDFNPGAHPAGFILTSLSNDLVLILACFLISWLLSQGSYFFKKTKGFLILKISGLLSLNLGSSCCSSFMPLIYACSLTPSRPRRFHDHGSVDEHSVQGTPEIH
jgi:hypothetical protein